MDEMPKRNRNGKHDRNLYDHEGKVDVEATREERGDRKIPPNPPPSGGKLDGKTLARLAVSEVIDCGSWKTQAVMRYYIDRASRSEGKCYPAETTTAADLGISVHAVRRANGFWYRRGYSINGTFHRYLTRVRRGRIKRDGGRESNAYHVGWLALIAAVRDGHFSAEARAAADGTLQRHGVVLRKSAI